MTGPRAPTPAQRRSADPARSVWVTANAGTGKTRVLADRVLRLLLEGSDPEGILCLTFTKAAAAEMTVRIEERLAAWATARDDAGLAAELEALTGEPPDAERLERARRLFARVLELPRGLGDHDHPRPVRRAPAAVPARGRRGAAFRDHRRPHLAAS